MMRSIYPSQKGLLLLDGHDSHKSYEFLKFCCTHSIVVLWLLPHTTHILQLLDVNCFQPLKYQYPEELYHNEKKGDMAIERYCFIQNYGCMCQLAPDSKHNARASNVTGLILLYPDKV
jgi:hypothetical protein